MRTFCCIQISSIEQPKFRYNEDLCNGSDRKKKLIPNIPSLFLCTHAYEWVCGLCAHFAAFKSVQLSNQNFVTTKTYVMVLTGRKSWFRISILIYDPPPHVRGCVDYAQFFFQNSLLPA